MSGTSLTEDQLTQVFASYFVTTAKHIAIGIGDDAAVVSAPNNTRLVATTDSLVEHVHFRTDWSDFIFIGRKAAVANISDMTAMGVKPAYALVSAIIPARYSRKTIISQLARGMAEQLRQADVALVGGNVSRGETFSISLTLFGYAHGAVLTRNGAQPGDLLLTTGTLGYAAHECNHAAKGRGSVSYVAPQRVAFAHALAQNNLATAAIDISDGFARDLHRVCDASGVGALVYESVLPIATAHARQSVRNGAVSLEDALYGGEDYELLFTANVNQLDAMFRRAEQMDTPVSIVGSIRPRRHGIKIVAADGTGDTLDNLGWEHFRHQS